MGETGGAAKPRNELEQLRQAMETRPVIDRALGVLMASHGCTPDEAWEVLRMTSQHTNTKLNLVAEEVTATTQGECLPEEIQRAVRSALAALGK